VDLARRHRLTPLDGVRPDSRGVASLPEEEVHPGDEQADHHAGKKPEHVGRHGNLWDEGETSMRRSLAREKRGHVASNRVRRLWGSGLASPCRNLTRQAPTRGRGPEGTIGLDLPGRGYRLGGGRTPAEEEQTPPERESGSGRHGAHHIAVSGESGRSAIS